jgi:hypothetical protein
MWRTSKSAFALALTLAMAAEVGAQCEPVWSSLGGLDGYGVEALTVHDEDGAGPKPPALIVGNGLEDITTFARWDGWDATSMGGPHESFFGIYSLTTVPEGTGMVEPGLYAGGELKMAGGVPVNSLARWADGEWHDVGGGVTRPGTTFTYVFAMQVFDEDGEGPLPPALFVGGKFEHAGGVPVQSLARWDGREWSAVGAELGSSGLPTVFAMTVYDDGRGPALYVGGSFTWAGGERALNIARWDGTQWDPVGNGLDSSVDILCVFDEDGPGPKRPALFAGGTFGSPGQSPIRIGRWDGSEWSSVGGWDKAGGVRAMTVWDADGAGPERPSLYVGGLFSRLPDGTVCNKIARWDGAQWHALGQGVTGFGAGTSVSALAVFDEDGPGPNPGGLYVGGLFYRAGSVETKHIARWGCPLPPSPPCYADCDGDGELAFFDFLCFQNLFAAADPGADCDGSGVHDFFDFHCFPNAFAAGCP